VAPVRLARPPALETPALSKLLKYARIEDERRFLLAALPAELDPGRGYERISDLYLDGTRLRLRLVRAPAGAVVERKLTQKLSDPEGAAARRIITSVYLDAAEYALLARLPGRRLEKRRHRIASGAHTFAIDVFEGALAGLVLAELELASEAELTALPVPRFAHCEVTALPLFTGGALAGADPLLVLAEARRLLEA
jgi:CYTH domain-containing protein